MRCRVSKMLLLMLLVIFLVAIARLINEGEWYLCGSLIVGLLTCRDELRQLWIEAQAGE